MIAAETISHIRTDVEGRAWIDDTNVKVIEVVKDWLAHGSSRHSLTVCTSLYEPLGFEKT
jgi:hypothetical protein